MTYIPRVWVDGDCVMAADMNNIENGVDRAQGDVMVLRGLTAAIPASDPLLVGRFYIESDLLQRVWRDNGAGWDLVPTGVGVGGAWTQITPPAVLGAPAATITHAVIPQTYNAIVLLAELRTDGAVEWDRLGWQLNGDTGTNYDWMYYGGGLFDDRAWTYADAGLIEGANARASNFSPVWLVWQHYARVDREKNGSRFIGGAGGNRSADQDIRWTHAWGTRLNTAATTSITLIPVTGANFVAGSVTALYGIT